MMIHPPYGLYLQAETKLVELEQEIKRKRLLDEAGLPPSTPRRSLALILHGLAERLAPEARHPTHASSRGKPRAG